MFPGAEYSRTASYNVIGQLTGDTVSTKKANNSTYVTTSTYTYGTGTAYNLGAIASVSASNTVNGGSYTASTTTNTYQWWSGALQNTIVQSTGTTTSPTTRKGH